MEKAGKPFVAAINGTAMGGGLEVCLACHYRVCADDPAIQLGLPEAKVGLIPGAGGTQRLPRMMGAMGALPLLLEGRALAPQAALKARFIDQVVPRDQLIAAAKAAIKSGTAKSVQPWDEKGFRIPGGGPYTPTGNQVFTGGNAMLRAKTFGNYPAQDAIMCAVYEGLQVPIDAALRIEARYMTKVILDPASGNMIRSLFLNMQAANKLTRRPKGVPETKLKKIAVLGAGMMGAGIAYVTAAAGLDVVLIDQSQDSADKGKGYSAGLLDKAIERGRATPEQKAAHLARITATTSYDGLKDADLVIEAVFETRDIKADVTKKAGGRAAGDRRVRLQYLDLADHGSRRGLGRCRPFGGNLHRRALLLARRQDAAGRDHPRQGDQRRNARRRHGLRQAHQEDADRRQRLAEASTPAACSRPTRARACACWPRASIPR